MIMKSNLGKQRKGCTEITIILAKLGSSPIVFILYHFFTYIYRYEIVHFKICSRVLIKSSLHKIQLYNHNLSSLNRNSNHIF